MINKMCAEETLLMLNVNKSQTGVMLVQATCVYSGVNVVLCVRSNAEPRPQH